MKKSSFLLGVVFVLVLALPAFAITFNFTNIDYPGELSTNAYGINDKARL